MTGWAGDTLRLECNSTKTLYGVYWTRLNASYPDGKEQKAEISAGVRTSQDSRFYVNDDYSLKTLDGLTVSDEGVYECRGVTKEFDSSLNTTSLTVNGKLQKGTWYYCYRYM